jgi:2-C-methyl-D-erythritol 4-phosphate cytidylyltransferase
MGTRLGCPGPKALTPLKGKTLLARTLERFAEAGLAEGVVVVAPPEALEAVRDELRGQLGGRSFCVIPGGAERQESVCRGLAALDDDTDVVVIHDAARPFVARQAIEESVRFAAEIGAATVAIPTIDTILVADEAGYLIDTPDRRTLWSCQTPQTFRVEVIREAHERATSAAFLGTDDATLVRRMGRPVKLVMGSPLNLKITTPADFALAELIVEKELA